MRGYRYLQEVSTLSYTQERCIGCGLCVQVCPHQILTLSGKQVHIRDIDLCMECGACAHNCPTEALSVRPGVGCAVAILNGWKNRLLGTTKFGDCC
ncbi:4Fe-4S binding protein [Desulfobulbus rhabdoformis]|uniref:mercury methylation ferredoxin HgcB n=1 Tax=Desulfobulbus rhabdoformis TaxID=34032 RepID=UPI001962845B|nr:mercury methylation ferredoxin HgcB [Desulfobulbus rhabdoformis]MBM9615550.1 4Fe-4S binding protein [Desulfobulbus rhabdoformis]